MSECYLGGGKPKITWDTTPQVDVRSNATGANINMDTGITVDLTKDGIITASDANLNIRIMCHLHEGVLTQIIANNLSGEYYLLTGSRLYLHFAGGTWTVTTTLLQFVNK